ncbi:CoA ester lyase [Devosia sp.]|uniref:HpcH/HpaI aldolase/citrate lyase family protein n=1 Tax=Devosia sp. TaxID=1871048 RepID=UPI001AC9C844|nr:CoA ester lyase [Devosia sp.]MBN9332443.1 CoA ester lyase [Devosia sp.]
MRSLLYVPADQERFIAKAHLRGADAVILDLEDAVPEDRKAFARGNLVEAAKSLRQGSGAVAVRINSGSEEDVEAALRTGVDLLVFPKANSLAVLDELDAMMQQHGGAEIPVLATIESPAGVLDAAAICRHPRLAAVNLGSEDFALELGGVPDPDVLRMPKLLVHYAAKAAGKRSLGLLRSIADYADTGAIAEAAREARRHGFDGATCVHPSAVQLLNEAFAPTVAEIEWARAVVATDGTVSLNGKMIDKPLRDRAAAILRQVG